MYFLNCKLFEGNYPMCLVAVLEDFKCEFGQVTGKWSFVFWKEIQCSVQGLGTGFQGNWV